jgi:hypothetical protein
LSVSNSVSATSLSQDDGNKEYGTDEEKVVRKAAPEFLTALKELKYTMVRR